MYSSLVKVAAISLAVGQPLVQAACSVVSGVQMTFYGSPDNDPPGSIATAHDCGGRNYQAGGSGAYDDPLTFATSPDEYEVCEIIYSPYLKKYLRMEDDCAQCSRCTRPYSDNLESLCDENDADGRS